MKRSAAAALIAVLAAAPACKASYTAPTGQVPVVAFQLHYRSALGDITPGSQFAFTAFVIDADSAWRDVTDQAGWLSSDPSVLRPSASPIGFHQAVAPGVAQIIGTFGGFSDALTVVVRPFSPAIPYLDFLQQGDPRSIGATSMARAWLRDPSALFLEVTGLAVWRSSDPRIATVAGGRVTGIAPGTVEISATYGNLTGRYGLSIAPRSR